MSKEKMKYGAIYFVKKALNYILRLFWVFPIKNNIILFTSFWGKQYSCNPKYICEYLHAHKGDEYKYIWALRRDTTAYLPEWIQRIEIGSFLYYYYRLCAKIIVTNCGEYPQIPVRKKQLLINTWHGGGCYKKCGLNQLGANKKGKYYQKLVLMAFEQTDIVLSTNMLASKKIFEESFNFTGKILNIGYPRNDILIHPLPITKVKKDVCKYINKENLDKVCLYAPTYRDNDKTEDFGMDYIRLKAILSARFGGNWTILYRGHQFSKIANHENNFINMSDYPDMQELLLLADVFITDYSSAIWDYQLLNKPVFIFATDLQNYKDKRGFYVPIEKWGASIATNMKQLEYNISKYSVEESINNYQLVHSQMGDCETGRARIIICKMIMNFLKNDSI